MRSSVTKTFVLGSAIAFFAGAASAQTNGSVQSQASNGFVCRTRIDATDWSVMMRELRATSPNQADRLANDRNLRLRQVDSLRQLLAFACQAVKDGVLNDPANRRELGYIRSETAAVNYDRFRSGNTSVEPMSQITDTQIADFYVKKENVARFEQFLSDRDAQAAAGGDAGAPLSGEEMLRSRRAFAKVSLVAAEFEARKVPMGPEIRRSIELQTSLQQAQFLADTYARVAAGKTVVSESEINSFIAAHSDIDPLKKRLAAESVLQRARKGENFARLADQFSEDPANTADDGKKLGGRYTGGFYVKSTPELEKIVRSLRPGQVHPKLIELENGLDIVKVESISGSGDEATFDVRHIIISTAVSDPEDPMARPVPVRKFVESRLESDKEAAIVARVLLNNPIVIEDQTAVPVKKEGVSSTTRSN